MSEAAWYAAEALPPEPYRRSQYESFREDRNWLAAHQGATEYRRGYVHGEFWPAREDPEESDIDYVEVRFVAFLGEDRGPVRRRSTHPARFHAEDDPEDAVNWRFHALRHGYPKDQPCPTCGDETRVMFMEGSRSGSWFWVECQGCRSWSPAGTPST